MKSPRRMDRPLRMIILLVMVASALNVAPQPVRAATQVDVVGPEGSGQFGYSITILPNGNWVVVDPYYRKGFTRDVGAVYLYDGQTTELISQLTGSTAHDHVGLQGIVLLANGNFVVLSNEWDNPGAADIGVRAVDAGAVTWCSAVTGCRGEVSSANSLVGSRLRDQIGGDGIVTLPGGNYIVRSTLWDHGITTNAGAATWCDGEAGCSGEISAVNSLVGTSVSDKVGSDGITVLANGNYIVRSSLWDDGVLKEAGQLKGIQAGLNVGAVTWCAAAAGCVGEVSPGNSLVGSSVFDQVGNGGIYELPNGNYLVLSHNWDFGAILNAGALTYCDGLKGCLGPVSVANSLVGSHLDDKVGSNGVILLPNGNYVVSQNFWDNGDLVDAGSVTWCQGDTGCLGTISTANSLVGSSPSDQVGSHGILLMVNGDYIVRSSFWDRDRKSDVGAVTRCDAESGCKGPIAASNSLIGDKVRDQVGSNGVVELPEGGYVVVSSYWDNTVPSATRQAVDAGAVTWCNSQTGCLGVVSETNSLVGNTSYDEIGSDGVTVLPNGNYVVISTKWNDGYASDAGAVTWCDGKKGCKGVASASNSLVGSAADDRVGIDGIVVLANSNYLVRTVDWDNGHVVSAGAVTWCDGQTGCTGAVSAANSLVGATRGDTVGSAGVVELPNGHYVILAPQWDRGRAVNAGAVTWCDGLTGCSGVISATNSLVGASIGDSVGFKGVVVLADGNYVVPSFTWDDATAADGNPLVDAGAVTWCDQVRGCRGAISAENSLVGTRTYDFLGSDGVIALPNGSYLVVSTLWDNESVTNAGAVTWCPAPGGCIGVVMSDNSLIGSKIYDQLGSSGIVLLSSGEYVIVSDSWDSALAHDAGVVTVGSQDNPAFGSVSSENSIWGVSAFGGGVLAVQYNAFRDYLVVARPKDNAVSLFK